MLGLIPLLLALLCAEGLAYYSGHPQWTVALVLGIIAGGLVDLDNHLRGRLRDYAIILLIFAGSSLLIQWSLANFLHFTVIYSLLNFLLIYLATLGPRYRTMGFSGLTVAIYTALTYQPQLSPWLNPLLILAGAIVQGAFALLFEWLYPQRPLQEALANGYAALASYLEAKAKFFDPDELDRIYLWRERLLEKNNELIQKFNRCREALFYRSHRRFDPYLHRYFSAQNIHERISSNHFNHRIFVYQLRHRDLVFRVKKLMELQGASCRAVAAGKPVSDRLDITLNGLRESLASQRDQLFQVHLLERLVDNLAAVNGQLQGLNRINDYADQRIHHARPSLKELLPLLASQLNLQNPALRHGLRLTVLTLLSCLILALLKPDFGYWILLTVLFVCQPNYSSTRLRVNQRIIGTLAGVLTAALVPLFFPSDLAKMAFVLITTLLFFHFRLNRYNYSTYFITLEALTGFALLGLDFYHALPLRLLDTVIGSVLAWLALRYLWADWHYFEPQKVLSQLRLSLGNYLDLVLQGASPTDLNYRLARREAHEWQSQLWAMNREMQSHGNLDKHLNQLETVSFRQLSHISSLAAYGVKEPLPAELRARLISALAEGSADEALLAALDGLNDEMVATQLRALFQPEE